MSHYHLEVVLPPMTSNIEKALATVMKPFREGEDDNGDYNVHGFWDYYRIGGRYSGSHIEATLDPAKLDAFHKALSELHITVSTLIAGKQTLSPPSQIPVVDELWRRTFPESGLQQCPLFDHFPTARYDVCTLNLIPYTLECFAFIVARPMDAEYNAGLADFMLMDSLYNGNTWQRTAWGGGFGKAVDLYETQYEHNPRKLPPESIVVTVDYHS